jgi:hypothetical protein
MSILNVNTIQPVGSGQTVTVSATDLKIGTTSLNSSGLMNVSVGSSSAPSISPSGDSNTGIFFPAADTFAISTGNNERVRFDNTNIEVNASSRFIVKTNGSANLTIDSSGRLLTPNRPYFYARTGRTGADGYTNNPYRFEDVLHNVGGHFVTSGTGAYERFVAPVAGIYCFQSSPGYKQTSVDWNVRIRINGTEYAEIGRFIGSPSSHSTIGGSVTLKLSANDYVDLNNGGSAYHINTTFNFFCGFLVG